MPAARNLAAGLLLCSRGPELLTYLSLLPLYYGHLGLLKRCQGGDPNLK